MKTVTIDSRFNGPPSSGNGGYTCGLVASLLPEPAEITLRLPPPLETDLRVVEVEGGVDLLHEGQTVAQGRSVDWEMEVRPPPSFEDAAAATTRYAGHEVHEFPNCFTCGVSRDDGLKIWPGKVEGSDLVASPWTVAEDLPTDGETVRPEIVWAALDCPGAWSAPRDFTVDPVVLGRMAARITGPVRPGDELIAYAWTLGEEGRKSYAGTAIADGSGRVLGFARQTWIALRGK